MRSYILDLHVCNTLLGAAMTDEEFNRYCAGVMGYRLSISGMYLDADENIPVIGMWHYKPATDLNKMAEVFDKLDTRKITARFFITINESGIAAAMREFIEGAKE